MRISKAEICEILESFKTNRSISQILMYSYSQVMSWMGCSQTIILDGMYAWVSKVDEIKKHFPNVPKGDIFLILVGVNAYITNIRRARPNPTATISDYIDQYKKSIDYNGSIILCGSYTVVASVKKYYWEEFNEIFTDAGFGVVAQFQNISHKDTNLMIVCSSSNFVSADCPAHYSLFGTQHKPFSEHQKQYQFKGLV